MTEKFIREAAERFDLTVDKRVTAGNSSRHFATFELTGTTERVQAAWQLLKTEWRGNDFDTLRRSGIDGALYIELQSVWCEEL